MRCSRRPRSSRRRPDWSTRTAMGPGAEPMAVIGAGSWGTALAILLAREGHPVLMWCRDAAQAQAMRAARRNSRYLPAAECPAGLEVTTDLGRALAQARDALIAVPSHAFREILCAVRP